MKHSAEATDVPPNLCTCHIFWSKPIYSSNDFPVAIFASMEGSCVKTVDAYVYTLAKGGAAVVLFMIDSVRF